MRSMKRPPAKTPSSSEASTRRRSKVGRKESSRSSKRTTMNKSDSQVDDHQGKLKKGPWTAEEDELLVRYIMTQGEGGWRTLPKRAGLLRCGKSCRLRWMNYLRPNVKRGHITPDEEDLILRLHRLLGNRIDDGNQPLQQLSLLPAAPLIQGGGGGGDDSQAVTMNILSTSSSLRFHMVGGQWDDTFQS